MRPFFREKRPSARPRLPEYLDPSTNPFFALRERLGLSQWEVSYALGLGQQIWSSYENNRRLPSPLTARRIQRLARMYDLTVTLDDLYRHVRCPESPVLEGG